MCEYWFSSNYTIFVSGLKDVPRILIFITRTRPCSRDALYSIRVAALLFQKCSEHFKVFFSLQPRPIEKSDAADALSSRFLASNSPISIHKGLLTSGRMRWKLLGSTARQTLSGVRNIYSIYVYTEPLSISPSCNPPTWKYAPRTIKDKNVGEFPGRIFRETRVDWKAWLRLGRWPISVLSFDFQRL